MARWFILIQRLEHVFLVHRSCVLRLPPVVHHLAMSCVSAARFQMEVCTLMCNKLKLSTWKVQLAVLQSMKAYFQGWGSSFRVKCNFSQSSELLLFELFLWFLWQIAAARERQRGRRRALSDLHRDLRCSYLPSRLDRPTITVVHSQFGLRQISLICPKTLQ